MSAKGPNVTSYRQLVDGMKKQAANPTAKQEKKQRKKERKQLAKQQMKPQPQQSKPKPPAQPRGLTSLISGLVSPTTELRMPTVDAPLTSCMTVMKGLSMTTPNITPWRDTSSPWGVGELVFTLYGQPGLVAVVGPYYAPSSASAGWFNCNFAYQGGNVLTWALFDGTTPLAPSLGDWPLVRVKAQSATQNYLSGLAMDQKPIGMSGGLPYVLLSGNESLIIYTATGTGGAAGATLTFEVQIFVSQDAAPRSYPVVVALDANGNIPANTPIYGPGTLLGVSGPVLVCVKFASFTGAAAPNLTITSLRVNNILAGHLWVQLYTPELDQDSSIGQQCRRTATTLSLINTSAFTTRQGTIIAARLPNKPFSYDTPAALSVAAQRYRGDASKGVFTYMEFSSTSERFTSAMNDQGGIIYDLDSDDFAHVVQITNPGYVASPNSFLMNISTALEFKTDSQRYSKAVCRIPHGDLIEARRVVNSTPWFFDCTDPDGKDIARRVLAESRGKSYGGLL